LEPAVRKASAPDATRSTEAVAAHAEGTQASSAVVGNLLVFAEETDEKALEKLVTFLDELLGPDES
jgi:hypothetical protein